MYIKLTRFDNTPVWINAAFVVTVEPRRQSVGSIVVPIGDGLDYEVRESPEQVLAMLDGAPVAAVVPVPPPKSLTKTPDDVSAEPMTMTAADVLAVSDVEQVKTPVKPAEKVHSQAKPQPSSAAESQAEAAAESETAADSTDVFANRAEKSAEPEFTAPIEGAEAPAKKTAKKTTRKPRAKKTAEAVPTAEQIERLRKMAPGSVKKLANTITSQLKLAGPDSIIEDLVRQGVLTLDHDHVIWN